MIDPRKIQKISKKYEDKNWKFRIFLKNHADEEKLDQQFHNLHNEIFIRDEYDCTKCANCCRVYDIRIAMDDIPPIAKHIGQSESEFIQNYLSEDGTDDDVKNVFILKEKPCRFLDMDGKCGIYEVRPLVCREYPHTNKEERLYSLLSVISSAEDCPVVFEILEQLKRMYNFR